MAEPKELSYVERQLLELQREEAAETVRRQRPLSRDFFQTYALQELSDSVDDDIEERYGPSSGVGASIS